MIELLNVDCMEYMKGVPDKFFELAIVDPPYGLGSTKFSTSDKNRRHIHKKKSWNDYIPSEEYFAELHRVSEDQIIWGCNYYAKYIPAVGRIVHDKLRKQTGLANCFSDCDLASNSKENRIVKYAYQWEGNVQNGIINWNNGGIDGRIHPTQKPVALYKWLLHNYAKPGDKILDTHLGSGSSAIAAHQMGFDFVGCEIDKEYYDAACKRFKEQTAQLKLL